MPIASALVPRCYDWGQGLRRRVWHPLRRMMDIFHLLPLAAAGLAFFILATQPQLREIYLSYLERLKDAGPGQIASNVRLFLAAAVSLGLISAALFEAHYALSTMRINVVYSALSDPESGSKLRAVQRIAAIGLTLVPWAGVVTGLYWTRQYLWNRHDQLCNAEIDPATMNYLAIPGPRTIFVSLLVLALALAFFLDRYRRSATLHTIGIAATPFAAVGLFLLLSDAQLGGLTGSPVVGALAIVLIVGAYYLGYYWLYTMRTGWIYTQHTFPNTGINRRRRRRIALFAWAAMPWLLVGLYFIIASIGLPSFSAFNAIAAKLPGTSRWAVVPVMMCWVVAAGLAVTILLDHFGESRALLRTMIPIIIVLVAVAAVFSYGDVDRFVWFYRALGPLAAAMLMLLFVVIALTLLAVLSQRSGFPALTLVVLVVVVNAIFPVPVKNTAILLVAVCALFAVMALLSRLWAVAGIAIVLVLPALLAWKQSTESALDPSQGSPPDLNKQFKSWLRQRPDAAAYSGRYPVFIVAAEGGGIYAASAASVFLAKLEDANPGFSQHVFAISGVSGGAIGATVFQALMQAKFAPGGSQASRAAGAPAAPAPGPARSASGACPDHVMLLEKSPATPLVAGVSQIMLDDHLSPVIGAIVPEFLGAAPIGRARAVAESFRASVRQEDQDAASHLQDDFRLHWSEKSAAPALLLNSTWAETGFRVAFSPFALHAYDDSLYSFSDQNMPGDQKSLIEAAVVSARFPGMLPPYSVTMNEPNRPVWNFVDGGYSDNSGASTALAIYRALQSDPGNADIKIILLTSSNPQPDLTPTKASIVGTTFRDTVAPITAMLKVREGLGNEAVARVCQEFNLHGDCQGKAASDPNSRLKIVELEVQTYELPLGWKLSHTTFDVVQWLLGEAGNCRSGNAPLTASSGGPGDSPELNEQTVLRNSCVQQWIAGLLNPPGAAAQ